MIDRGGDGRRRQEYCSSNYRRHFLFAFKHCEQVYTSVKHYAAVCPVSVHSGVNNKCQTIGENIVSVVKHPERSGQTLTTSKDRL